MNDYKELIENLQEITERGTGCEFDVVMLNCMENAVDAIEQLVKEYNELDKAHDEMFLELCKVKKERDAAIDELRREANNCKWCKWWKPNGNSVPCTSPELCCVDGNPDRWEWRGVTDD